MGTAADAPNPNECYRFGAFTLDVAERRLTRDGAAVTVAPRVFDTLLILVRNSGSLVRKSDLMSFVWPGARVEEVNLAHNISDLRRLLGASAIQTVPKHGYRFVEPVETVARELPANVRLSTSRPRFEKVALPLAGVLVLSAALAGAFAVLRQLSGSPPAHIQVMRSELVSHPQAVQLYLKGRYYFNRRRSHDFETAVDMFRQATALDSGYAEAYAGLAAALVFAAKPMNQVQAALNRALDLNPNLAEAHALLGLNAMNGEWDWPKAEREFRRAIQLDPNLAEAHQWFGDFLGYMGRFNESTTELDAAIALDPLSPILWSDKCEMLTLASRYSQAIAACRYVLEMNPNYFIAHYHLVHAYILNRQPQEALETALTAVREDDRPIALARLAQAYAAVGDSAHSRQILEQLSEGSADRTIPFEIATCYSVLSEREKALDWLERTRAIGGALMIELKMSPFFNSMHSQPRFRALLKGMRF